jgi:hypothetical protein
MDRPAVKKTWNNGGLGIGRRFFRERQLLAYSVEKPGFCQQ